MRSITLCGAAALLISGALSTGVHANPDMYVSGALGGTSFNYPYGGTDTAISAQLAASIAYNFTPVLGMQGDLVLHGEFFDPQVEDEEFRLVQMDAALHLFYREQNRFLLGVVGQLGRATGTETIGDTEYSSHLDRGYLGLEAQVFIDQVTLYGQFGAFNATPDFAPEDFSLGGLFATAEVRYFLSPDLKLELHAGLLSFEAPGYENMDGKTLNLGGSIEYKFDNLPISGFVAYDFTSTSLDIDESPQNDHRFRVGVKFNHGSDSLLDRDRAGAGLKPVLPLLHIVRGKI